MFYNNWFDERKGEIFKDFFSYLSIPSISADSTFKKDLLRASKFIESRLKKIGMDVSIWEEAALPIVFGEKIIDKSYPTVLIYGHYDVQPPDPLELWNSKPFSPEIRDGKIFARGAEDNKGQNFYSLLAIEAFYAKNKNPKLNIKVLIEGEEEIGSPSFEEVAKKYEKKLKADSVWIVDMGIESYENPIISLGVRGIVGIEVKLLNSEYDLHSGSYGGAVYNPAMALCEILGSVHDDKGKIAIDGFYDTVIGLSKEEKEKLYLDTDQTIYEEETTAKCFHRQEGVTLQESIALMPTFEINGIVSGYGGEGSKTIIPKEAMAKITCRLVAGQNPDDIGKKVKAFIRKKAPKHMKVDIKIEGGGLSAWTKPSAYSAKVFSKIIEEITGNKCSFTYSGGSIPLTAILAKYSGGEYIFLGTALPQDRIHAPDENFSIKQFTDGYHMIAKGLEVFAENKKQW